MDAYRAKSRWPNRKRKMRGRRRGGGMGEGAGRAGGSKGRSIAGVEGGTDTERG